jgi:hypothetical protein
VPPQTGPQSFWALVFSWMRSEERAIDLRGTETPWRVEQAPATRTGPGEPEYRFYLHTRRTKKYSGA